MHKLPIEFWNELTYIIKKPIPYITTVLHNTNHTPNIITSYSFIFGLISIHYLINNNIKMFMLTYFMSFYCDVLDGYFARQYNMTSKFGDYYDHFTDILIFVIIVKIISKKYKKYITKKIKILFFIFVLMLIVNTGCEKLYSTTNVKETLDVCIYLCPIKSLINITKYFDVTIFVFVMFILLGYLERQTNSI